jgi:Glycyl-tRNA synthetase, beta subunit
MTQHQRYFPVFAAQGHLLPPFCRQSANDHPACAATIRQGNERVLQARLADAQFFYQTDMRQPLAAYVPQLAQMTFQEQLGSVWDKVRRIETLLQRTLAATPSPRGLRAGHSAGSPFV